MADTEYLLRRKTVSSAEILYKDTKTDSVALASPRRSTEACAVGLRHMAVLAYPTAGCPNTYGAVLLTYGPGLTGVLVKYLARDHEEEQVQMVLAST